MKATQPVIWNSIAMTLETMHVSTNAMFGLGIDQMEARHQNCISVIQLCPLSQTLSQIVTKPLKTTRLPYGYPPDT